SIQAENNYPYGKSKKVVDDSLLNYSKETGAKSYVYRIHTLFGKWSMPNYNTVVDTFCHNIAIGLDIQVNDPDLELNLCYID
ncbi:capsular polysaccharide biosynthesis protein CapF, partial [Bacillus wiedmannii]|nr:capsular polysaccharide biosynthesis protein CapF [Bacillus wiedmannii]